VIKRNEHFDEEPDDLFGTILNLLGAEGTLALVEAFAGCRLFIPKHPRPCSALSKVVGAIPAQRLSEHYGGLTIKVPLAKRWRVAVYRKQGWSYPMIARRLCMHETTVFKNLQEMGLTRSLRTARRGPATPASIDANCAVQSAGRG